MLLSSMDDPFSFSEIIKDTAGEVAFHALIKPTLITVATAVLPLAGRGAKVDDQPNQYKQP